MDYSKKKPISKKKTDRRLKAWIGGVLLGLVVVTIGLSIGVVTWYNAQLQPVDPNGETTTFVIPKGTSTKAISESLEEAGLIKNKWAFLWLARQKKWDGQFQAGSFQLSPQLSALELGERLLVNADGLWVTFPEGIRKEEMASILENAFGTDSAFSAEEFVELTNDSQGRLFPETYLFPTQATTDLVIQTMEKTYSSKVQNLESTGQASGYSEEELVVLASLLEREASRDEDLPIVSGILFNRLEIDMPLQVDATLQYAKANIQCGSYRCDDWWPTPLAVDKELDSAYNTYAHTGLPPSAIANPGLRALTAAFNPEMSDYFYYITDNQGNMHYAETYEEHLVNVNRYLR